MDSQEELNRHANDVSEWVSNIQGAVSALEQYKRAMEARRMAKEARRKQLKRTVLIASSMIGAVFACYLVLIIAVANSNWDELQSYVPEWYYPLQHWVCYWTGC